jgi:hypothetical protein
MATTKKIVIWTSVTTCFASVFLGDRLQQQKIVLWSSFTTCFASVIETYGSSFSVVLIFSLGTLFNHSKAFYTMEKHMYCKHKPVGAALKN